MIDHVVHHVAVPVALEDGFDQGRLRVGAERAAQEQMDCHPLAAIETRKWAFKLALGFYCSYPCSYSTVV